MEKRYRKNYNYIACLIHDLGGYVINYSPKTIWFYYKFERCNYHVQAEWLSGKSVKDGRGVEHLIKQLS